jgi:hypothetical protein
LVAKPEDPEDDVAWLEVSPDDLDAMLLKASGGSGGPTEGKSGGEEDASLAEDGEHPLRDLAKKVEAFVGGQGDMEGARFAE